jgi:hypothetical protein
MRPAQSSATRVCVNSHGHGACHAAATAGSGRDLHFAEAAVRLRHVTVGIRLRGDQLHLAGKRRLRLRCPLPGDHGRLHARVRILPQTSGAQGFGSAAGRSLVPGLETSRSNFFSGAVTPDYLTPAGRASARQSLLCRDAYQWDSATARGAHVPAMRTGSVAPSSSAATSGQLPVDATIPAGTQGAGAGHRARSRRLKSSVPILSPPSEWNSYAGGSARASASPVGMDNSRSLTRIVPVMTLRPPVKRFSGESLALGADSHRQRRRETATRTQPIDVVSGASALPNARLGLSLRRVNPATRLRT